ncbi:MAG: class I SAM-dependent methyltransferase [Deltaproteobacteria bacterium]|nr:class I SAM-dependent methyltransferase [Deltaproteobacteria bacterium]
MYKAKTAYFDESADAPWAATEYGPDEIIKLERLFKHTGSLSGCKVLEPGCGTGRLTEILSDRVGNEGSVAALDISPMMVAEARRRTATRQNVEIYLGPLEEFPMNENSYDLIICHQVFPHFEDKKKALIALSEALKPDGTISVIHFINFKEINDMHRKAGTAVEMDVMPEQNEMRRLFNEVGMEVAFILDDHLGYFLSASRKHCGN